MTPQDIELMRRKTEIQDYKNGFRHGIIAGMLIAFITFTMMLIIR
jgi:hypothetical protein